MKYRLALILPTYAAMFVGCYLAAYLLRFEFKLPPDVQAVFLSTLLPLLAVKMTTCLLSGEWKRSYRFAVFTDIFYVVGSATGSCIVLFIANSVGLFGPVPRSVILIDWALTIPISGLVRVAARGYAEIVQERLQRSSPSQQKRALILGTGREAVEILRAVQTGESRYDIVGLVGDETARGKPLIGGVRTYSPRKGWQWLMSRLSAELVLIPGSVPGRQVRELVEESRRGDFRVHVIPSVNELVDGRFKLSVRDVTITDLLRREPARLDMDRIRETIEGRRILVTGAAGSIGSELCRQILSLKPSALVLLDQSELGIFRMTQEFASRSDSPTALRFVVGDVTSREALRWHLREQRPDTIFHAAAYKHVPLMESNSREAVRNNVFGTQTVVESAAECGVERFILVSTDKAVHPTSVMGATKFLAEKCTQVLAERSNMCCITVRFGNVLNSAGSVVPTFRRQIEQGGPLTVTHPEMERYFMTIPEAVQLVLQAAAIGASGDLLVLEMGRPCKIVDLARDMIALSGLRYPDDIDIVFTGLRPGEKLHEELFYESEECITRVHEKIVCVCREVPSAVVVERALEQLHQSLALTDDEAVETLWATIRKLVSDTPQPATGFRRAA